MTFCLETKIIEPDNNEKIDNAVILLHGYGGDGTDISMLTLNWKRFLNNTIFLCPNGHQRCSINPSGYQWFDLSIDDEKYITDEAVKAEIILNKFIEQVKKNYNILSSKIVLCGFSQGCMMAINIALTNKEKFNCVVGFSGKIIDEKDLESRKKISANILLTHGENDEIVSPNFMLAAKDFFIRNNINNETHLIKNCGHHIPVEASSIALNYISKKFNNS
jgi:phospholipase/carboxylesterase